MTPTAAEIETARAALTYERPCPCFQETPDPLSAKRCTDGFCRIAIERIAAALAAQREKDAGICDKRRDEEKAVADKSSYPSNQKMHLHGARVADRLAAAIRKGETP